MKKYCVVVRNPGKAAWSRGGPTQAFINEFGLIGEAKKKAEELCLDYDTDIEVCEIVGTVKRAVTWEAAP